VINQESLHRVFANEIDRESASRISIVRKETKPLPSESKAWLKEIAAAYIDAEEAIPFGPAAGAALTKKELFHLAPAVCIKFRGFERLNKNIKKVTEAALSTSWSC